MRNIPISILVIFGDEIFLPSIHSLIRAKMLNENLEMTTISEGVSFLYILLAFLHVPMSIAMMEIYMFPDKTLISSLLYILSTPKIIQNV